MQRQIPSVLWVGLVALAVISVIQFLIGITRNPVLLIAVAANVIVLLGLHAGHRWAYVFTIGISAFSVLAVMARNPCAGLGVLVIDGLVVVPVILSTDYFWRRKTSSGVDPNPSSSSNGSGPNPLFCPVCGQSLVGVTESDCPRCRHTIRQPR